MKFVGFPVHAGIDPSLMMALISFTWFPRTRGDRPWPVSSARPATVGFPVHAGIDPSEVGSAYVSILGVSPYTRG